MEIESNVDAVIARLRARADRLRNLTPPLTASGMAVRDMAYSRFVDPSNGWAPNSPFTIAQKGSSRPGIDTGTLRNSISSQVSGNTVTVGTNLRYASWVQNGTGIFAGRSEWTIYPRKGSRLRFIGPGGTEYFARKIVMRGAPARPFLLLGDAERARVHEIFRAWVMSLGDADAITG